MPYFYYYTDDGAAQSIVRSGKILSSVAGGVGQLPREAYGNGIYVTSMESSSIVQRAINNLTTSKTLSSGKVNRYFVIDLPDCDVKKTNFPERDVHLYAQAGDLKLRDYAWWLTDFDSGRILASYKYKVSSLGPAEKKHPSKMGDYTMTEATANGRPVYRCVDMFLFMNSKGRWMVGPDFARDEGGLLQMSNHSLGPDQRLPWKYCKNGDFTQDDGTLNVTPFQTTEELNVKVMKAKSGELKNVMKDRNIGWLKEKVNKLNQEIEDVEKKGGDVDVRKKKREDLKQRQALEKNTLFEKYKEDEAELDKKHKEETVLDEVNHCRITFLRERRDELLQVIQKLTIDLALDTCEDRDKLETSSPMPDFGLDFEFKLTRVCDVIGFKLTRVCDVIGNIAPVENSQDPESEVEDTELKDLYKLVA